MTKGYKNISVYMFGTHLYHRARSAGIWPAASIIFILTDSYFHTRNDLKMLNKHGRRKDVSEVFLPTMTTICEIKTEYGFPRGKHRFPSFSDGYARSGSFENGNFSQSFRNISHGERRNGVASVTSHNYPSVLRYPLPGKARSTNLSPISANFLDSSRSYVYPTANHS